jgi:hypothetical protein
MAYEATTELAKKQRDLAKARIEAELNQTLATNRRRFGEAGRQQESAFEGRGILRSGEASRGRAQLVGEETAAELAARLAAEQQLTAADLTYAQQLAAQQAAGGGTGGGAGGGTGGGTGSPDVVGKPIVDTIQPVDPNQQKDAGAPSTGMPSISPEERVKITPSGQGSGQNPNTWSPGQYVSGPDRKLSNGGAVVNGYYIPPGTFGNLAPTPTMTNEERVKVTPSGQGSGQNPNTWSPGQYVSGPDRKLSNGGAVVNGYYIPPGTFGNLAPTPIAPTPPAGGRGTATASPPGKAPAGYTWVRSGNTWKLSKVR